MAFWGAAAAAAGKFLNSSAGQAVISSLFGLGSSAASSGANWAMYKDNQAWQERMSNTAHQREVADLRAAGLNPVLSANNGANIGSVSTPAVDFGNFGSEFTDNYIRRKQLLNETALRDSQIDLNKQYGDLAAYQGDLAHHQSVIARENAQLLQTYGALIKDAELKGALASNAYMYGKIINERDLTRAQIKSLRGSNALDMQRYRINQKEDDFYNSDFGKIIYGIGRTINSLSPFFK